LCPLGFYWRERNFLDSHGKAVEWEHLVAYGGQYLYIWRGMILPGMKEFRREVFVCAKKELIKI